MAILANLSKQPITVNDGGKSVMVKCGTDNQAKVSQAAIDHFFTKALIKDGKLSVVSLDESGDSEESETFSLEFPDDVESDEDKAEYLALEYKKTELNKMAKELKIEGYTKMSEAELSAAIVAAI